MKLIELTQGKFSLVDDDDYDLISSFKWCASLESRGKKWYAIRWIRFNGMQIKIRMHCMIMRRPVKPTDGLVVHHADDNSLNNQKSNLEIITQEENMARVKNWKRKAEEPFL